MSKILLNESRLLGSLAKWAVQQSPYHRPVNLERVLDLLHHKTKPIFKTGSLGYIEFDNEGELRRFIHNNLRDIPEYLLWNDRKNGNDAAFKFTSRFDADGDPDDDFIDLDALERNVTAECLTEY